MSVSIDSFLYRLPYDDIFGGVSALTVDQFQVLLYVKLFLPSNSNVYFSLSMVSRTCSGAGVVKTMTWPTGWELRSCSSLDTQQTSPGLWFNITTLSDSHLIFCPTFSGTRCWNMQKTKPILSDSSISILVPREWGKMVTTAWNTRKWSLSWSPCTPGWWWTCQGWKPSRGSRSWGLSLYLSLWFIQGRRCQAIFTLWCKTRYIHVFQHALFPFLSDLRWI